MICGAVLGWGIDRVRKGSELPGCGGEVVRP